MKKIIKQTENGIVQITIADERWYQKGDKFVPSVTWIAGHYPKGIAFYKWLADKGWDEAESIKNAAGDKGSKVHQAIDDLIAGKTVRMDSKFINKSIEQEEELSLEEYEAILSFHKWFADVKPKVISNEFVAFSEEHNYAGTVDLLCEIDGQKWIVDFKTSQNIWAEYELQLSAYKHAIKEDVKLAILQVGYRRNKNGYKWNQIEDKFPLFLASKQIWANENEGVEPRKRDYPEEIKL